MDIHTQPLFLHPTQLQPIEPKTIRGKYEADIHFGVCFRMTVYESNFTQDRYEVIQGRLIALIDAMGNDVSVRNYDYTAAAQLTGIHILQLTAQIELLFHGSEYCVGLSLEEGDLMPTISIHRRDNGKLSPLDSDAIQLVLERGGITPIFNR